jgi:hypothetical protein
MVQIMQTSGDAATGILPLLVVETPMLHVN